MNRPIDKVLAAYQLRDLQTFRNILISLDNNGLTINQALRYVWYATRVKHNNPLKDCPECDEKMALYPVNTSPRNQVGGSYKSQWYCSHCGHSIYSKRTLLSIRSRALRKQYKELENEKYNKELEEWEMNTFTDRALEGVCPDCKKEMYLYKVDTPAGPSNVNSYRSVWFCDHCNYEKYSNRTIKEEALRLRRI